MTRPRNAALRAVVLAVSLLSPTVAAASVITFDESDFTPPTPFLFYTYNNVATFSGADMQVGTAFGDPFEPYPPLSPLNDNGTPLDPSDDTGRLLLSGFLGGSPTAVTVTANGFYWTEAGAYITGASAITMTAFFTDGTIQSVSTPGANFVGNGDGLMPNLLLSVMAAPGQDIAYVVFSDSGNLFTLENFTYTASDTAIVPVPAALPLMATALAALGVAGSWRQRWDRS